MYGALRKPSAAMDGYPDLSFLGTQGERAVSDHFDDILHFYHSFDTREEAESIVLSFCSEAVCTLRLEQVVDRLMEWKLQTEPWVRRAKRLKVSSFNSFLWSEAAPQSRTCTQVFEDITHSDPSIMLELAKRVVKRERSQTDQVSRASKEERDRKRYALELACIIKEAALPITYQIELLDKPELAWQRAFGARRSRTLRNRLRVWNKFRSWLNASFGIVWPKSVSDIINYVEEMMEAGCAIMFPTELVASLFWSRLEMSRRRAG